MRIASIIAAVGLAAMLFAVPAAAQELPAPSAPPAPQEAPPMPPPGAPGMPGPMPPPGQPGMMPPGQPGQPAMSPAEQQELRELIETVKIARLSKELGLSDEQSVLLVRKYDETRRRFAQANQERQVILRELKEKVRSGKSDDDVQQSLDKLIAHDREAADARMKVYEEVGRDLTATQRAKLYVFINEFDNDMRRLVQRAREAEGSRLMRFREMRGGFQQPGEAPGGEFGRGQRPGGLPPRLEQRLRQQDGPAGPRPAPPAQRRSEPQPPAPNNP